jgi:hypothetical protein
VLIFCAEFNLILRLFHLLLLAGSIPSMSYLTLELPLLIMEIGNGYFPWEIKSLLLQMQVDLVL